LIFVVPEYNGSMPGILKYFIDHWKFRNYLHGCLLIQFVL
jgi:NAD(P)H-dependent FMN reductase